MKLNRFLIIIALIGLVFGCGMGYFIGRFRGNRQYTHALENGIKWRDRCDSLERRQKRIDIELEVNRRIYRLNKINMELDSIPVAQGGE